MLTIKDEVATLKRGRRVTVELEPNEYLMSFKDGAHYRLGGQVEDVVAGYILIDGQVEDVVAGYIIIDAHPVCWCSVTQKWEDE